MCSHWARTLQPAAGTAGPRSVVIMVIAAASTTGSPPSRRTTWPVRRFGFSLRRPPFFFAASRAATRAWRARSTPLNSVLTHSPPRPGRHRGSGRRARSAGRPTARALPPPERAAACSRSCSSRTVSRCCAVRSRAVSAALVAPATASVPSGWPCIRCPVPGRLPSQARFRGVVGETGAGFRP